MKQTQLDLEKHFNEQLGFLKSSCDLYDNGSLEESKRIASVIRTLLHDTKTSKSLLDQLGKKDNSIFFDSSMDQLSSGIRAGGYAGLVSISSQGYIPNLDNVANFKFVNFEEYWNKIIFIDNKEKEFSRKDIILFLANQDGGSHIDPNLDNNYGRLSRENSIGWMSKADNSKWKPLEGVELVAVRQIGHELLKTFIPNYSKNRQIKESGFVIGGAGIYLIGENKKVGRNDNCPCGKLKSDGKPMKYKKCCGRNM